MRGIGQHPAITDQDDTFQLKTLSQFADLRGDCLWTDAVWLSDLRCGFGVRITSPSLRTKSSAVAGSN
jgi:hypothetical protein